MKIDIKRILVPTDFSDTSNYAVEKACRMAAKMNAKLYIIHVLESAPYKLVVSDENPKEKVVYQKNIMDRLGKIAKDITEQYQVEVDTLIGEAKVTDVIEEAVKDNKIDIIIMGTSGASGMREFLIGSNAQRVVVRAACPVITFKVPPGEMGFKTIVLPVESWNSSIEKLDYVTDIAKTYDSQVHLLGIIENRKKADMRQVLVLLEAAEKYLKEANISFVRKIIASDQVAKEALVYAEEIKANLIVVMTEHESKLQSVLPGLLAKQIANHSEIPVMSIKPAMYHTEKVIIKEAPVHRRKEHSNINK
ncbi:MAG TPA: universal stress protein [Bacteroidia bacterium]|jgi:nucleotide-binding universal stress UspA family protein|nr:universal stress protein [Bacteroidia bacterium]